MLVAISDCISESSRLDDGAIVLRFKAVRQFQIGSGGHVAEAEDPSTGVAVFDVQKNGVSIGSITFSSSATGVLSFDPLTVFYENDILRVVAPATADATLSDIGFTFLGKVTFA